MYIMPLSIHSQSLPMLIYIWCMFMTFQIQHSIVTPRHIPKHKQHLPKELSLEFWSWKIWPGLYNITVEILRALTIKLTRTSARTRAMSRARAMARAMVSSRARARAWERVYV